MNDGRSPSLEADVHQKAVNLEEFFDRITSPRVVIETAGIARAKLFCVRIDLRVPGRELVVAAGPGLTRPYEDVHVATWAHKQLFFRSEAREKMLHGATALADAVRITLGPKSRCVLIEKKLGQVVRNDRSKG